MLLHGGGKTGDGSDGSQVRLRFAIPLFFITKFSVKSPHNFGKKSIKCHAVNTHCERKAKAVWSFSLLCSVENSEYYKKILSFFFLDFLLFVFPGQPVYHRWECIEEGGQDTFGMLVHSCYVDNGFGDRVDILDENGCGLDAVRKDPLIGISWKNARVPGRFFFVIGAASNTGLCAQFAFGNKGIPRV